MPADHAASNIPYDEWVEETVGNPDLNRDASTVVLVDDRPAALSWLEVDTVHRVAQHDLTGTARAFRRRGLARLAKLAALRWCAQAGIARVTTGNDSTNVGMLAINDEVGFRPYAVETEWVKPLS
jgi:RimJ/RimL family protein N-acetyltransferase